MRMRTLTRVHICANRPRQGEKPQQPPTAPTKKADFYKSDTASIEMVGSGATKQVKIPPLTDREVLLLRKFCYFVEELQVRQ